MKVYAAWSVSKLSRGTRCPPRTFASPYQPRVYFRGPWTTSTSDDQQYFSLWKKVPHAMYSCFFLLSVQFFFFSFLDSWRIYYYVGWTSWCTRLDGSFRICRFDFTWNTYPLRWLHRSGTVVNCVHRCHRNCDRAMGLIQFMPFYMLSLAKPCPASGCPVIYRVASWDTRSYAASCLSQRQYQNGHCELWLT